MGKRYLEHQNPPIHKAASAPYNFVPLPERIVEPEGGATALPSQERFYDPENRKTGFFEVELTTKSPLFIRGALSSAEEQNGVDTEASFYIENPDRPVIPGSSLRGMLRHMVSIVSYSKLGDVTDQRIFHRTPGTRSYSGHFGGPGVHEVLSLPGFMVFDGTRKGYMLKPCEMARLPIKLFSKTDYDNLYTTTKNDEHPAWAGTHHQWQKVWVRIKTRPKKGAHGQDIRYVEEFSTSTRSGPGWKEGMLVLSGNSEIKKHPGYGRKRRDGKKGSDVPQFVFFEPDPNPNNWIPVEPEVVSLFHNEQMTKWQEHAFPAHEPAPGCREKDGWLRTNAGVNDWGDPVFFLFDDKNSAKKKVFAFGRSLYFRVPYKHTPADLIPDSLKDGGTLDFVEALFGYTEKDQPARYTSYRGRVQVTSAFTTDADCIFSQSIMPRILETPKPTTFQHYLVQRHSDRSRLSAFDDFLNETELRGHKLYWHHGGIANGEAVWRNHITPDDNKKTQSDQATAERTPIVCVKPEKTFRFRVYFEALSLEELGALCWALQPNGDPEKIYVHRLGMGKPLGLGSVALDATLHFINPLKRYSSLFRDSNWQEGLNPTSGFENLTENPAVEAFENCVLARLDPAWESGTDKKSAPQARPERRNSGSGYSPFANLDNMIEEANRESPEAEAMSGKPERLRDMRRIALFLKMLEWPGFKPEWNQKTTIRDSNSAGNVRPNTRYMIIDGKRFDQKGREVKHNEYKDRPVLPDPGQFGEPLPEILGYAKVDPRVTGKNRKQD